MMRKKPTTNAYIVNKFLAESAACLGIKNEISLAIAKLNVTAVAKDNSAERTCEVR